MGERVEHFFEDFAVGQVVRTGSVTVTAEQIKAFAASFDPQPFHLDEAAARGTFFGELVASGWMTASLTMRLLVDSDLRPAGGLIGAGVESIRWPAVVRPGDVLRAELEVLELRASRSRPDLGIMKTRVTLFNQRDEVVQVSQPTMMVKRRAS